jgi:hypothetical protein
MLEHFQQGQRRDVDGLGRVVQMTVLRNNAALRASKHSLNLCGVHISDGKSTNRSVKTSRRRKVF